MRELITQELEVVNGAGIFRDVTGWIGEQSGSFIGRSIGGLLPIPVINTLLSNLTAYMGKKVGGLIGDAFGSMVESIFKPSEFISAQPTHK
ncbi:hypothetical protein ACFL9S_21290 [Erwinia sp. AnSW2-5]|uniref:hypothetical protein n=1 Tax=Erwinia sp. AnSW2-5 TaxID=3367692 RepID=UPI00385A3557